MIQKRAREKLHVFSEETTGVSLSAFRSSSFSNSPLLAAQSNNEIAFISCGDQLESITNVEVSSRGRFSTLVTDNGYGVVTFCGDEAHLWDLRRLDAGAVVSFAENGFSGFLQCVSCGPNRFVSLSEVGHRTFQICEGSLSTLKVRMRGDEIPFPVATNERRLNLTSNVNPVLFKTDTPGDYESRYVYCVKSVDHKLEIPLDELRSLPGRDMVAVEVLWSDSESGYFDRCFLPLEPYQSAPSVTLGSDTVYAEDSDDYPACLGFAPNSRTIFTRASDYPRYVFLQLHSCLVTGMKERAAVVLESLRMMGRWRTFIKQYSSIHGGVAKVVLLLQRLWKRNGQQLSWLVRVVQDASVSPLCRLMIAYLNSCSAFRAAISQDDFEPAQYGFEDIWPSLRRIPLEELESLESAHLDDYLLPFFEVHDLPEIDRFETLFEADTALAEINKAQSRDLFESRRHSDVIFLTSDDATVRAHRVMMAYRSEYFFNLLLSATEESVAIDLSAIQLEGIMQFFYTGECSCSDLADVAAIWLFGVEHSDGTIILFSESRLKRLLGRMRVESDSTEDFRDRIMSLIGAILSESDRLQEALQPYLHSDWTSISDGLSAFADRELPIREHIDQVRGLLAQRRFNECLDQLTRALQLNSLDPRIHRWFARVYVEKEKFGNALMSLGRCMSLAKARWMRLVALIDRCWIRIALAKFAADPSELWESIVTDATSVSSELTSNSAYMDASDVVRCRVALALGLFRVDRDGQRAERELRLARSQAVGLKYKALISSALWAVEGRMRSKHVPNPERLNAVLEELWDELRVGLDVNSILLERGYLSFHEHIHDKGFAGYSWFKSRDSYVHAQTSGSEDFCGAEIFVVDADADAVFRQFRDEMESEFGPRVKSLLEDFHRNGHVTQEAERILRTLKAGVGRLARRVADWFSGNTTEPLDDFLARLRTEGGHDIRVPIGEFKGRGVCRHRSVTFKHLCDLLGIPCRLVLGRLSVADRTLGKLKYGGHMWCVVLLCGKLFLADVMNIGYYGALKDVQTVDDLDFQRAGGGVGGYSIFQHSDPFERSVLVDSFVALAPGQNALPLQGATACVQRIDVVNAHTGIAERLAFKSLDLTRLSSVSGSPTTSDLILKYAEREALRLRFLEHQNILALVDTFHVSKPILVLDSGVSGGTHEFVCLVTRLYNSNGQSFLDSILPTLPPWCAAQEAMVFLVRVACGLRYIHSSGLVHLDVKPANVLVEWDSQMKQILEIRVCDLAGAKQVGNISATPVTSTAHYRAPEIDAGGSLGVAADVYSLGMMMESFHPYLGGYSELVRLWWRCKEADPEMRPTIEEILRVLQDHCRLLLDEFRRGSDRSWSSTPTTPYGSMTPPPRPPTLPRGGNGSIAPPPSSGSIADVLRQARVSSDALARFEAEGIVYEDLPSVIDDEEILPELIPRKYPRKRFVDKVKELFDL